MTKIEDKRDATVERMLERLDRIEDSLADLGDASELHRRIKSLEESRYANKDVLTFEETCEYIGVSGSLLYKLTASRAIPHYKPRGKMVYFKKLELNEWLLHNQIITVEQAKLEAASHASVLPTQKNRNYGKRNKK